MLTKKELKEMIAEQINESDFFNPSDHPYTTRKQDKKARDFSQLDDAELSNFFDLLDRKQYGRLTRDEKNQIAAILQTVAARKRSGEAGGELDPEVGEREAIDARARTEPPALASLGRPARLSVDPYGKTQSADSLGGDTIAVPRIKQENKAITQSRLRQIIKEELMIILTDDEVEEMFGIDPGEASKEV